MTSNEIVERYIELDKKALRLGLRYICCCDYKLLEDYVVTLCERDDCVEDLLNLYDIPVTKESFISMKETLSMKARES